MLLSAMKNKLEGVHVGFLRQVTRMQAKSNKDGTWKNVALERVLQGAGKQPLQTYIDRRTVEEWVDSRPIFDICVKETGTREGGSIQELCW